MQTTKISANHGETQANQQMLFIRRLGCPVHVKRNLVTKVTAASNARKDRKRIVLKARQSSETDDHEFDLQNKSKINSN